MEINISNHFIVDSKEYTNENDDPQKLTIEKILKDQPIKFKK